jgi:isoleucyl-tRNA synthetase
MYEIILGMVKLMAPVLCFTAEEIWKYLPGTENLPESVHLASLPALDNAYLDQELAKKWETLLQVRAEVSKVLEAARNAKVIGHSLDAQVELVLAGSKPPELYNFLQKYEELLPTIFITSAVVLKSAQDAPSGGEYVKGGLFDQLYLKVTHASGEKCARCWKYSTSVGQSSPYPDLCNTCASVLETMQQQPEQSEQSKQSSGE